MGFTNIYNGLISARFLTLLAHILILVVLLWDREENLQLCLTRYNPDTAQYFQNEYILTIGLSMGFNLFELIGFVTGVSMFSSFHSFTSIMFHCGAAVLWSITFLDRWDCSTAFYWWIFALCSPIPFVTESAILLRWLFRLK